MNRSTMGVFFFPLIPSLVLWCGDCSPPVPLPFPRAVDLTCARCLVKLDRVISYSVWRTVQAVLDQERKKGFFKNKNEAC
jgi:hypothetical protein